jgi:Restriction endonuclease FokI, C terminal
MITDKIEKQIIQIWDKFITNNQLVLDTKGNTLDNLDERRIEAIKSLKTIVGNFLGGKIEVSEFKTSIDSFNKQNNFWGFTSVKGQMFFNLLLKTNNSEEQIEKLTDILKKTLSEPKNLEDALTKIELLDKFTSSIFSKATDKRKAPNPGSVSYFLSYFWQIHNYQKWAVMYSSIIVSFTDIGLWKEYATHKEAYDSFFNLNEEIKKILTRHTKRNVNNWEVEHSFWNFRTVTAYPKPTKQKVETKIVEEDVNQPIAIKTNFDITDYLIPKVARLVELGGQSDKSSAAKGSEFEKLVSEIFKQLDFEVETLGQGTGRNPDAIIKSREENTAFIVDAKAYTGGYSLGTDDRAIKEYINHYCPKLQKEGYKKIGFIIVSNSFKTSFDDFINDITWNTDIKRFILIESDALLHLLAYKTKDKFGLSSIIENLLSIGNLVKAQNVIEKFEDI